MGDMKRNYLVLALVFSSVLLSQFGCQEQVKVAEKTTPAASLLRSKTAGAPDAAVVSPPQKAKAALASPEKSSPKITFVKAVYDFGQIGPSTKNYGEFRFTNTGEGLLKIKDVDTCCGVVTKLDKKEYAPGESGVLKVEYSSTRSTGIVRKNLYVISNDKAAPKVALTVKANIIQKVIWQPKSLKLLLGEENAGCSEIILSSVDNRPFSITAFKSTLGCITADVDPSVEATKFVLQPKVDMDKLRKTMRGNVYISVSHPDCDGVGIGFDVLSRFTIKPPLLIIFYVDSQTSIKRYVWILNNYGEDFEIESTSSKEGFVKVLSQKKIRTSYQLGLEITPPAVKDKKKFMDEFFINIKGGEKLRIVCQGIYSGKNPKTQ